MAEFDLDDVVTKLRGGAKGKPGKKIKLLHSEITTVCQQAVDVLMSQPMLIRIGVPLVICGDIHGQYYDLLRIFEYAGYPPNTNYMFMGDYVDRGDQSIEVMSLLLAYKIKYPENFFLLRGNHESEATNHHYGFYHECKRRYDTKLWKTFNGCFNCLPVAGIVGDKIFCCHGGMSPELKQLNQIRDIPRPIDVPRKGLLCDLLWADPDPDTKTWAPNTERRVSWLFGADVVAEFLQTHHLDLFCRGHQVVENGYEFFAQRKLVTVFSAPNYGGEMNTAAIMFVNDNMLCTMHMFEPEERGKK